MVKSKIMKWLGKEKIESIDFRKFLEIKRTPYTILRIIPSELNSNMEVIYFINSLTSVCNKRNKPFKIIGGNIIDLFLPNNNTILEANWSTDRRPVWWEMYYEKGQVYFYMYIPEDQERKVRHQVQRTWKRCTVITETTDYMPKWDDLNTDSVRLDLKCHNALSLATERQVAPIVGILQSFKTLDETDKAVFQIGLQYADGWNNDNKDILERFKDGYVPQKWNNIGLKDVAKFFGWLVGIVIEEIVNIIGFFLNPKHEDIRDMWNSRKLKLNDLSTSSKQKYTRTSFYSNINVIVESENTDNRETFLRGVESAMMDMNEDNQWKTSKVKSLDDVRNRKMRKKSETVLSDKELCKIIALPDKDMQRDFKNSVQATVGDIVEPPTILLDPAGIPFATWKAGDGTSKMIYIPINNVNEFVKSKYFLGATRSGKSTAGTNFAIEMFKKGFGSCFIDIANGKTISEMAGVLTEEERKKVAFLDFTSAIKSIPIGFNELLINEKKAKENINVIEVEIIYFFETLSGQPLNMRAKRWLGKAIRAVMTHPDATILDIIRMMTDKAFRESIVDNLSDPFIKRDWDVKWNQFSDKQREQIVNECFNRIDLLLDNTSIRNTVCLPPLKDESGNYVMDFKKFMDEGWLVLIQLSDKDLKASEAVASLLVSKMFLTSLDRTEADRPFHLIIDEPHKVIKSADRMKRILVECAKYRFSTLLLIHEWSQLADHDRDLPPTCINNCGHFVYFKTGTDNLKPAKHRFEPFGYDYNNIPNMLQQAGEGLATISAQGKDTDTIAPIKIRGLEPLEKRYKMSEIDSVVVRDMSLYAVDEEEATKKIFEATANMDLDGLEDSDDVPPPTDMQKEIAASMEESPLKEKVSRPPHGRAYYRKE